MRGWKNDVFSGIEGNNELGRKGFILEAKIVGRCGDEFYRITDAAGNDRVIKLTKLDQRYDDIPRYDDNGNVVGFVEAQVDLKGTLGDTGTRLFIDGKSASTIGTTEPAGAVCCLGKGRAGRSYGSLRANPRPISTPTPRT